MGKLICSFIRRTFCWLNVVLWICSCAILVVGICLRISYGGYASLLPDHLALSIDAILMGVGIIGFVVSFFGCCGAWLQSKCLLMIYLMLILILFLSECLIGCMVFVFRAGWSRTFANELRFGIENHYNVSDRGSLLAPSVSVIWDNIQTTFECCGINSYEDWYNIQLWSDKNWVPNSCCKTFGNAGNHEMGIDATSKMECGRIENPSLWWSRGCVSALEIWIHKRINIIGCVTLGIAAMQLYGLLTSALLYCMRKPKDESTSYKSYTPSTDSQRRRSILDD